MPAARIVLLFMLLAAITSTAEAQLLPRRRVAVRVGQMMADFGGRVTAEALNEGLRQGMNELGDVLDLKLSLELYAQTQMGPQAELHTPMQSHGRATQPQEDRPRQDCLGLLLEETARLAARLEQEKFSPPVLEKMVLDYQGIGGVRPATDAASGSWSSRQIVAGKRSVTCVERHRPPDTNSKSPKCVHISLVFRTKKESQDVRRTVDLDLCLDKEKKEGPPTSPWKVKNVQYDRPAVADKGQVGR